MWQASHLSIQVYTASATSMARHCVSLQNELSLLKAFSCQRWKYEIRDCVMGGQGHDWCKGCIKNIKVISMNPWKPGCKISYKIRLKHIYSCGVIRKLMHLIHTILVKWVNQERCLMFYHMTISVVDMVLCLQHVIWTSTSDVRRTCHSYAV